MKAKVQRDKALKGPRSAVNAAKAPVWDGVLDKPLLVRIKCDVVPVLQLEFRLCRRSCGLRDMAKVDRDRFVDMREGSGKAGRGVPPHGAHPNVRMRRTSAKGCSNLASSRACSVSSARIHFGASARIAPSRSDIRTTPSPEAASHRAGVR